MAYRVLPFSLGTFQRTFVPGDHLGVHVQVPEGSRVSLKLLFMIHETPENNRPKLATDHAAGKRNPKQGFVCWRTMENGRQMQAQGKKLIQCTQQWTQ